ncbi:MAG: nucleotidyl transferase AbiEii/AbiGii toxin family protein [bacterium]|nr:nucleotidyl transferase AbiEii/AbiGii toxin family protein [bacterium]
MLEIIVNNQLFKEHDIRFVGGTALSYLINHRLSEDLDFAMLELCRDEVEEMMLSYGAVKIKHDNTALDYAKNEGGDLYDYHLKYILDGIKVEFFIPPFNLHEKEIWINEPTTEYKETNLKIASLGTIMYMKSMAFWNRKKYRDLFDIHYAITHIDGYDAKVFIELYLKYNITYTKEMLYTKIKSKIDFYEKRDDEGISTLVENAKSYEWYRSQIEDLIYDDYLAEIYNKNS